MRVALQPAFRRESYLLRALVLLTFCGNCSGDTGILIAVSGRNIDALSFEVGLQSGSDFVWDRRLSVPPVDVSRRNLQARPYEFLLRQSGESAAEMTAARVLAIAHESADASSPPVGYAVTEPPQRFIEGRVLRRTLRIEDLGQTRGLGPLGPNCVPAWEKTDEETRRFDLLSEIDRDCDGSTTQDQFPDCDDRDAAVFPGAIELCDGKDNDCDGKFADQQQRCYLQAEGRCHPGRRICRETEGGYVGDCEVDGQATSPLLCQLYHGCGASDPLDCVDAIDQQSLSCAVAFKPDGVACGGLEYQLRAPGEATSCHWQLFELPPGLSAKLSAEDGEAAASVEACDVTLHLTANTKAAANETGFEVGFSGSQPVLLRVSTRAVEVADCAEATSLCEPGG